MVNEDLQNENLYTISQQEVLRIERILKGGVDSDIDSEDESSDASEDEQLRGPSRFLVALEQDEQQLVLDYGDVELFGKWQSCFNS